MKPAEFHGSACLMFKINTSTGRSSTYGFARSWRLKTTYRIGCLKFSTPVFRDLSKPKECSHPKQPRPGLFISAWKIGLTNIYSASPSRKVRSLQLRITQFETRATSELK